MEIRAVVTDIDGTIVGRDGTVSAATLRASRELARKSILLGAGITPDDAVLTYGADDLLDIAPPGTGKGSGVLRALETLGVEPGHAVAFELVVAVDGGAGCAWSPGWWRSSAWPVPATSPT